MFPALFSVGPVAISSLGVFSFLAFIFGTFLFWRRAKEEGLDEERVLDAAFLSLLFGLITGRLAFILEHWPDFWGNYSAWFDFQRQGGLSFSGIVFGVAIVLWLWGRRQKWHFWMMADLAILGVIWAQIFLRLGQFLDGSYYGRQTNSFLGLVFPGVEGKHYPLQLLEIVFLLVVFFWLRRLEKHYRLFIWYQDKRGEARPGFITLVYLLSYSVFRFLLAFWQDGGIYWGGLAQSQWASLGGILVALLIFSERMGRWEALVKGLAERRAAKPQSRLSVLVPKERLLRRQASLAKKPHIKAGSEAKF